MAQSSMGVIKRLTMHNFKAPSRPSFNRASYSTLAGTGEMHDLVLAEKS